MVTTPKRGYREIFYSSPASDSEDDDDDESSIKSKHDAMYEDWRIETVKAYPAEVMKCDSSPRSEVYLQIPAHFDSIFQAGNSHDDLHSILNLLTGQATSTEIMDGYLHLRLKKYYQDLDTPPMPKERKRKLTMPSKEYTFRRERRGNQSTDELDQKATPPVLKRQNFQCLSVLCLMVKDREADIATFKPVLDFVPKKLLVHDDSDPYIVLAPLYAGKHLYLAVFDFSTRVITVYDSSWHFLSMELRKAQIEAILKVLTNQQATLSGESSLINWTLRNIQTSCPQYDEYSCGIYTIHYADIVLRGIADDKSHWKLSNKRVVQIRRHMAKELLKTTAKGRLLLDAISE